MKNGLISVRGTGAATFNEHLTTGNVSVIGCEGTIIRMIQVDLEKTYVLSDNKLGFGSIVNMEVLDGNSILDKGAIVRLYNEEKERIVKINYWDNTYSGVVVSDGYRGTYTLEGQEEVFVDGFGLVKYQGVETEYDLNLNVVTFEVNSNTYVCRLNTNSYTYTNVDIALDNTLVSGKTFTSCYTYYCSDYAYTSDTTFTFMANGIVVIKSISADHDSGDDMCSVDLYAPIFASREGVNGTYTVNGNKISISINGIEFILKIKNVLDVEEIVCYSTNLDSDSHGYFGVNTIFIIE